MKKPIQRFFAVLLLLITMAALFCSCKKVPEQKVIGPKELYEQYLTLALEDMQKAQDTYVYFINDRLQARAKEAEWTLQSYEIEKWEQVSENLYAAITTVETNSHPEPYQIANFVGRIDGEYRVILGILNLPEDLKSSFDYTKYMEMDEDYPGEVRFDDPSQLPDHEKFYRTYLETLMEDRVNAMAYRYFINPEAEDLAKSSGGGIYNYAIEQWDALADNLWVVYWNRWNPHHPTTPDKLYNFVMFYEGKYQVVAGIPSLPECFKSQIDTQPFYDFYGDDGMWADWS